MESKGKDETAKDEDEPGVIENNVLARGKYELIPEIKQFPKCISSTCYSQSKRIDCK